MLCVYTRKVTKLSDTPCQTEYLKHKEVCTVEVCYRSAVTCVKKNAKELITAVLYLVMRHR